MQRAKCCAEGAERQRRPQQRHRIDRRRRAGERMGDDPDHAVGHQRQPDRERGERHLPAVEALAPGRIEGDRNGRDGRRRQGRLARGGGEQQPAEQAGRGAQHEAADGDRRPEHERRGRRRFRAPAGTGEARRR